MSKLKAGRAIAGALALMGLVAMGLSSMSASVVTGPGVVDATTTWKVRVTGDGRYRWTLEEGRTPQGHAVVSEGVMQSERGDPMVLTLEAGVAPGATIAQNQPLARLHSTTAHEQLQALEAERALLLAEQELLAAGGRPEVVRAAEQAVAVAEGRLEIAEAQAEHISTLADDGASSRYEAEEATRLASVADAELALAQAKLDEARRPAMSAESEALVARVNAVDARLTAARARAEQQVLAAPFAGELSMPGGDIALQVHAAGPRLLRVAVAESERRHVSPGNMVSFIPTANPDNLHQGKVLAVDSAARSFGGQTVVWVVAELDDSLPVGATGSAAVSRTKG